MTNIGSKNFNIILFRPQIPPNTGNIIRLCSNTNSMLHLIKPFGFEMNNKSLRRAGLDYLKDVTIKEFLSLNDCIKFIGKTNVYFITKFGKTNYSNAHFKLGDTLIFGSEIDGLPNELLQKANNKQKLFIPMNHKSRSLNLSNAVSICIYEAWKQNKFCN
ncbi:MAG: tRNA (uridine(34)/cytosine(34)/5-carboxymethylaminomethyluridine(34)-2'-O)-methyltransferase TrmL [Rickettsiales bacterium]|nr:tRNA (uridine(34)/cytosine(34)/5-carboxymethylaminomethyluridine(34)-2'-O)-methyltransferase TrmL [Rickettsiales bacterium]|tara:strand:- start:279 stop:758 length:480 start_codon:yes stop_codon:yes gene_type:complete